MGSSGNVLIVTAEFYQEISSELEAGARDFLDDKGITYTCVSVPGAFEIPAAVKMGYASERFGGFIALGCVIRGETSHYDYVCSESARGLSDLALRYNLPIGYGILTVENHDQAWVRASRENGNKGGKTAAACIQMMLLKDKLIIKDKKSLTEN
tara:strand:+ start:2033 stop:2494 length:462 start_codon:yes stop_codon:yes gene_type:complete